MLIWQVLYHLLDSDAKKVLIPFIYDMLSNSPTHLYFYPSVDVSIRLNLWYREFIYRIIRHKSRKLLTLEIIYTASYIKTFTVSSTIAISTTNG